MEQTTAEVRVRDETRVGVKALVDSGLVKIPKIYIHPAEDLQKSSCNDTNGVRLEVPTIDLGGVLDGTRRKEIVKEICEASERVGFFQLINHGVPINVIDATIDGVRRFNEQPSETKMKLYTPHPTLGVRYYSNEDFQETKKELEDYMTCIVKLRDILCELLSEALGLSSDYLSRIECMRNQAYLCHYYPACPEPELTLGMTSHSDVSFLTVLLQDHTGGLQVLHQNHWVDVLPKQGALIANIGDLMQLITNDKFKSVEHRVVAKTVGPRISVACFLSNGSRTRSQPMGPIKELLSPDNPPIYKEPNSFYFNRLKPSILKTRSIIKDVDEISVFDNATAAAAIVLQQITSNSCHYNNHLPRLTSTN
ncbi:hypothetical protein RJ640_003355 [Escallonia rubra]|uniref:Fe2OG dioxygenase domain-containing protein n=1 Tax=Escallonia rubra TaxID=112253 RepID=A0AA88QKS7_9ASTE|nr:hypothetical protein RJ640_003355 [Escallonia rubra]